MENFSHCKYFDHEFYGSFCFETPCMMVDCVTVVRVHSLGDSTHSNMFLVMYIMFVFVCQNKKK